MTTMTVRRQPGNFHGPRIPIISGLGRSSVKPLSWSLLMISLQPISRIAYGYSWTKFWGERQTALWDFRKGLARITNKSFDASITRGHLLAVPFADQEVRTGIGVRERLRGIERQLCCKIKRKLLHLQTMKATYLGFEKRVRGHWQLQGLSPPYLFWLGLYLITKR